MRVLLALIVALGAPVAAHAADDGASARALTWSAKREFAATAPEPAAEPRRPEAMALSGQYLRGRIEAPEPAPPPSIPGRYRAAAPPPYQVFTPQVPLPMQQQAMRTASLPATLYSAPATQPAPQSAQPARALRPAASPLPPAPVAAMAPQPAREVAPEPVRMAVAPPPPAQPRTMGEPPRLYSVHRDYGLAPDAIPEPPSGQNRYVLIGPPDGAPATAPQDDEHDDQNDRQPAF